MTARTIRIITASVASADAVLEIADKLIAIPLLPGWLVSEWPTVLFALIIFDRVGHALIGTDSPPIQPPKTP